MKKKYLFEMIDIKTKLYISYSSKWDPTFHGDGG